MDGTHLAFYKADVDQGTLREQVSIFYLVWRDPIRNLPSTLRIDQTDESNIAFLYSPDRRPGRRLPMQIA